MVSFEELAGRFSRIIVVGTILYNPFFASPTIDVVLAETSAEKQTQTRTINIPGLIVEVKEWKPEDISERITNALKGNQISFEQRESLRSRLSYSKNGRWALGYTMNDTQGNEYFARDILGVRSPRHEEELSKVLKLPAAIRPNTLVNASPLLFLDVGSKRVFDLTFNDENFADFPSSNFIWTERLSRKYQITDNGVALYHITWPYREPGREKRRLEAIVLADPQNSRKTIFRPQEGTSLKGYYFFISDDGKKICAYGLDRFYMLDTSTYQVLFNNEGTIQAMTPDAEIIVFEVDNGYYRTDLKTKKLTPIWKDETLRNQFVLSPDGNFCAANEYKLGEQQPEFMYVYVHRANERFCISILGMNHPSSIGNDGTVIDSLGRMYRYKDGMYHWATEGKEKPLGLVIEKER